MKRGDRFKSVVTRTTVIQGGTAVTVISSRAGRFVHRMDARIYRDLGEPTIHTHRSAGSRYAYVTMGKQFVQLHRLVTGQFKGDRRRIVVDHLNGDALDNRRSNLEVVTQSVNVRRAIARKQHP